MRWFKKAQTDPEAGLARQSATVAGARRWADWPAADALLLHPAFGLTEWSKALPVQEHQLPEEWLALPEEDEGKQLDAMAQAAFSWALDEGADEVRVQTYDKSDRQTLLLGGFAEVDKYRFIADARPGTVATAAGLIVPERIWVTRDGRVTLYLHETWDSLLVDDSSEALQRLRERLPVIDGGS